MTHWLPSKNKLHVCWPTVRGSSDMDCNVRGNCPSKEGGKNQSADFEPQRYRRDKWHSFPPALFVTFNQLSFFLQAVEAQSQLHQGRSILLCIPTAIPTMWTVPGSSVWISTTVSSSTSLTWTLNFIATAPGTMWQWVTDLGTFHL